MRLITGISMVKPGDIFMRNAIIRALCVLVLMSSASGCVALAIGAAGGAAGVTYAKGKLTDRLDAPIAQVHAATIMALEGQGLPIHGDEFHGASAKVRSETVDYKDIWINIESITPGSSKITIRVSAKGNHPRQVTLLDAIKANL